MKQLKNRFIKITLLIIVSALILFNLSLFYEVLLVKKQEKQLDYLMELLKQRQDKKERDYQFLALLEEAASIREMQFKHHVPYKTIDVVDLQKLIKEEAENEFAERYPPEVYQRILEKFGYLKSDQILVDYIKELYEEQVQGMYDEDTGQMILVANPKLTSSIKNTFLIHELTHALQDQHFHLKEMPLHSKNEDLSQAVLALVEGDAALAMMFYYKKHLTVMKLLWDITNYISIDQSKMINSPYFLRENLVFPYKWGLKFVVALYEQGGWQRVNEVFENPPQSTEQILHPEKYYAELDEPKEVNIPDYTAELSGWKKLETNTAGEFNIRVLIAIFLGEYESIAPSAGWAGDKWEVWENPENGKLRLYWYTLWDTEKDAKEFFNVYRKVLRKLRPKKGRITRKGNEVMVKY